jgi:hypothetical protein
LLHLGARHSGDLLEELAQAGMHDAIPSVKEALVMSTTKAVAAKLQGTAASAEAEEGQLQKPATPARPRPRYDL